MLRDRNATLLKEIERLDCSLNKVTVLNPAIEYIKQHNFTLTGDPYGILWIRSHEAGKIRRYFAFYLPIDDK